MSPDTLRDTLRLTAEELDWLKHAAQLKHMPVREYVRRAINKSLRQEGVDAVLLKENEKYGWHGY